MAVQTAKAFRTALRKEPLQNFYYLYGADLVQVAELTDQLVQVATNQQPESALTKLDGKNSIYGNSRTPHRCSHCSPRITAFSSMI